MNFSKREFIKAYVTMAVLLVSTIGLSFSSLIHYIAPAQATNHNVLYFTYDDGPHDTYTRQILDLFDQYNGKATFFVVADYIDRHPDVVTETFNRGHSVQNHSRTHPHLTELSDSEILNEIQYTQNHITNLIGVAPTCFRPPFGDTDSRVQGLIESQGLSQELWDVSARDWEEPPASTIFDRVVAEAGPGSNILLHDGPFSEDRSQTVEATRLLLEHYSALGYTFEAMPQCSSGGSPPPPPPSGDNQVIVRARGNTGEENIDLRINGQTVGSWNTISTSLTSYTATVADGVTINDLKVHYTNNGTTSSGGNKNALIDYVEIDGVRYQAEAAANESLGSWTSSTGCSQGFKSSEWINCNGWIDFAATRGIVFGGGSGGNTAPVANAGSDQTVVDSDNNGSESVTLNGGGSGDSDGTIVSYAWEVGGQTVSTSANPTLVLNVGSHTLTLTVTDDDGATDSDTVVVTVSADSTPPPPPPAGDNQVVVRARGNTGEENIDLRINGQVVGSWNSISTSLRDYTANVPSGTAVSSLRVHYTNNGTSSNGGNKNAFIDYVEIDGVQYQSEASANESLGSWTPGTGCSQGFKSSEWINCNGWIDFAATVGIVFGDGGSPPPPPPPPTGDSEVIVRARGNTGEENIDLRINGQVIGSWSAIGTTYVSYSVVVPSGTTINSLRVHYTNNGTTASGGNKNAQIDYVEIDGTRYQAEATDNESQGSWTSSTGCSQGFKSSEWINCNGWIDFAAVVGLEL